MEVEDNVIYHKTEYRERRDHFAYFACSEPVTGFDTQREDFLGPYRGWDLPAVVENGKSTNSVAHGWQPIGSHHVKLTLAPGEQRTVLFLLGYHENPVDDKFDPPGSQTINKRSVKQIIQRYLDVERVEEAFDNLKTYWQNLLDRFRSNPKRTHRPHGQYLERLSMYGHVQYVQVGLLFESGIGRGMGFRDSNQDLLGFVHMVPERARQRISIFQPPSSHRAALITNISRLPSTAIMMLDQALTMTRPGWCWAFRLISRKQETGRS